MPSPPNAMSQRGRRVTIAEVAARAGVSASAVSKVFNANGRISEATRQRIEAAALELGWQPSSSAVALRSSRTRVVGLVLYRAANDLEVSATSAAVVTGIESALSPLDYGLLLYMRPYDLPGEVDFYQRLAASHRVDGVILIEGFVEDPRFALLNRLRLPGVLLGTPPPGADIVSVDADPAPGLYAAVDLLAGLGHRHIGYIGGPEDRMAPLTRRRVFEAAVGARPEPIRTTIRSCPYAPELAAEITLELLSAPDRPTALVYASDPMAAASMRRARQRGFRIPEDVSIVGFDGLPIGQWVEPALTSIHRDPVQRGRAAAWALLQQIGEDPGPRQEPPVPRLVVRDSTGPAPS